MQETPDKIIVIDFGSQYTQLIARRIREYNVYSEIRPFNKPIEDDPHIKGVILSGGPCSVTDDSSPSLDVKALAERFPVLAICYGAQLAVKQAGGRVEPSNTREFGRSRLVFKKQDPLFESLAKSETAWMSHSDSITELPDDFEIIASTEHIPVAAYRAWNGRLHGLQFHPEVTHTPNGNLLIESFISDICGASNDWTPAHYIDATVEELKAQLEGQQVLLALSGGVDSSVAAGLLHKAIGERLHCVFVDTGLLRESEFEQVLKSYEHMGLNINGVRAGNRFLDALEGVDDPEKKRKLIGGLFIDIFDEEAQRIGDISYLAQGTIYPDVIESVSVNGPSVTIKSHHNVGGLPEKMNLKVVEPLRYLFKDEVRKIGTALGLPKHLIDRHPFPGPGLAIRIPGKITRERVAVLQKADRIFIDMLREYDLYHETWQAFAVLLPVDSVGVMGDERTYENVLAIRAVTSVDGMTADWARLPYDFLAELSNRIINNVKGVNRVVYDISSKPPATIEWE